MTILIWASFVVVIIALLAIDLGLFHRKPHEILPKEALVLSFFWLATALLFNGLVYLIYEQNWASVPSSDQISGAKAATLFFTGYIVEKSLSIDNIFVIAMIFSFFNIPLKHQHRLLFWGVFGAIILRAIMIFAGITLIQKFSWLNYVLGTLLIITAIKMLIIRHDNIDPNSTIIIKIVRKFLRESAHSDGAKLLTRIDGEKAITPMGMAFVLIGAFGLLFAVDSVPAVMAITLDPFIIFTTNVFAMLGLRSLYFALAGMMDRFRFIKISLVYVLTFVGVKIMMSNHYLISPMFSLFVILGILSVGVIASITSGKSDTMALKSPIESELARLSNLTLRTIKKIIILVVGSTLLLLGTLMIITPGPGVPIMIVGLLILGTEFVWAKTWLTKVKSTLKNAGTKARKVLRMDEMNKEKF